MTLGCLGSHGSFLKLIFSRLAIYIRLIALIAMSGWENISTDFQR